MESLNKIANDLIEGVVLTFCGYGFTDFNQAVKDAIDDWQEANDYPDEPTYEQLVTMIEKPSKAICQEMTNAFDESWEKHKLREENPPFKSNPDFLTDCWWFGGK